MPALFRESAGFPRSECRARSRVASEVAAAHGRQVARVHGASLPEPHLYQRVFVSTLSVHQHLSLSYIAAIWAQIAPAASRRGLCVLA